VKARVLRVRLWVALVVTNEGAHVKTGVELCSPEYQPLGINMSRFAKLTYVLWHCQYAHSVGFEIPISGIERVFGRRGSSTASRFTVAGWTVK